MHISIWQQFSSNHSSSFTVIGEFPTRADAEHAADEIRGILKRIEAWYTEHPNGIEGVWMGDDWGQEPSPPELELAEQYQVHWEKEVDHRTFGGNPLVASKSLKSESLVTKQ